MDNIILFETLVVTGDLCYAYHWIFRSTVLSLGQEAEHVLTLSYQPSSPLSVDDLLFMRKSTASLPDSMRARAAMQIPTFSTEQSGSAFALSDIAFRFKEYCPFSPVTQECLSVSNVVKQRFRRM
jgi:hypothetical protein